MRKSIRLPIVLCMLLMQSSMLAQEGQIPIYEEKVEYWIDSDFAGRKTATGNDIAVDISGLGYGIHFFNMLTQNKEGEPAFLTYAFFKREFVTYDEKVEYWIDNDFAGRKTATGNDIAVDISGLDHGIHFFNMLTQNKEGEPAFLTYAFFKREFVTYDEKVEYWIDSDFAGRKTANSNDITVDISGLDHGIHFFNMLTQNKEGEPAFMTYAFYKVKGVDVDFCDYWIDDDVEGTHGIVHLTNGEGAFTVDISRLEFGTHKLHYMEHTTEGDWSDIVTIEFEKTELDMSELCSDEWAKLQVLHGKLVARGFDKDLWDMTKGAKGAGNFYGLQVIDRHLTKIDISARELSGELPKEVFSFPMLESLNVSKNTMEGDLPESVAALAGEKALESVALKSLNVSDNRFSGNVGKLAEQFPELTTLNASVNAFDEVSPMISENVTELDLSKQTVEKVVDINLTGAGVDDITAMIPSVMRYDHAARQYRDDLSLMLTTADAAAFDKATNKQWAMQIAGKAGGAWSIPYFAAASPVYTGENGAVVNALGLDGKGNADGSSFRMAMSFGEGDADFVGGVNVNDLQATILYAFDSYKNKVFNLTAADTYADSRINVQDVVNTVDILLDMPDYNPGDAYQAKASNRKSAPEADAALYVENGELVLYASRPVAALTVDISDAMAKNIVWSLSGMGFTASAKDNADGCRAVIYSTMLGELPEGRTVLAQFRGADDAQIVSVTASDVNAEGMTVVCGSKDATGITEVTQDGADKSNAYTINGVKADKASGRRKVIIVNGKKIIGNEK